MNKLAKRTEYLFMQDGACAHTPKLDYCTWGILERNVYRGRNITNVDMLKGAILEEWDKIPQDVIDNSIDAFKKSLNRVVEKEGRHTEKY